MTPFALIGAIGGAILGTLVWGGIAYFTGWEHSLVAILVGFLVGIGAHVLDGEGVLCGFVCAILCVGAIFCGKYMAVIMYMDDEIAGFMEMGLTEEFYQEQIVHAEAYAQVDQSNRTAIFQFMVDNGYSYASTASEVTEDELNEFWEYDMPRLNQMAAEKPSFEEWKNSINAQFDAEIGNNLNIAELITDSLDLIDLLFITFGTLTAFRVGSGMTEEHE